MAESKTLSAEERAAIERVYAELRTIVPGFSPIAPQHSMVDPGAEAFAGVRIALVEAPTGVGKRIGHLVPGMVLGAFRDRWLIVATATVAVQEQIAAKDLPAVTQAMHAAGMEAPASAIVKGRERYVCTLRPKQRSGGSGFATVSLPRGTMRFAQAVGRLVRSVSDWGEVVVLDRRLASSAYGRRMLAPVPMRVLVA